jgi:hypothetical protein
MSAARRAEDGGERPGALSPRQPRTPRRRTSRRGPAACAAILGGEVGRLGVPTAVGTPWWAYFLMGIAAVPALYLWIVIPGDSRDKLSLWREWLKHLRRRN